MPDETAQASLRGGTALSQIARPRNPADDHPVVASESEVAAARSLYSVAMIRKRAFGPDAPFGDPSWYLLLDLFIADAEQRVVSASSAALASFAPATTGLRHLTLLEEQGLIMRSADTADGRRSNVALTRRGARQMRASLALLTSPVASRSR